MTKTLSAYLPNATVERAPASAAAPELHVPLVVIGAGGCGLSAALAARDAGAEVLVVERDEKPWGTTSMSTGLIPAAGTPEQAERGIDDGADLMAADILAKHGGKTDAAFVGRLAAESAETVAWLRDRHGVPLSLIDGFRYPGHSALRMYGTPNRTGAELMAALLDAAAETGVDILTGAAVETLIAADDGHVLAVRFRRPDGALETVGCDAAILATCGFAGNQEMVAALIPELAGATFHGHPGAKGEALAWGEALGAAIADIGAYQGHGGLAAGHAIPILWPLIMEGGFQVNRDGRRFSDESKGYSEQAVKVVAQPGSVAWSVFDGRLHQLMMKFDDFQQAVSAGAVLGGGSAQELAAAAGLPADALAATMKEVDRFKAGKAEDPFGRDWNARPPLAPPFHAVKVVGALFHTQGGLVVDGDARVLRQDGTPFPNLFAGGGAARGVSGPGADGYVAGNGMLTATTLGKLAGRAAAAQIGVRAAS